eukprot:scaffold5102_cov17-Tisochrysis_lutea.AAC.1
MPLSHPQTLAGTIESFLFVFLQELGANSTLMGLTLTITCLAEVPTFQLTGWLVGKLGAPRLMQVALDNKCVGGACAIVGAM